jgi:hypothetical protein
MARVADEPSASDTMDTAFLFLVLIAHESRRLEGFFHELSWVRFRELVGCLQCAEVMYKWIYPPVRMVDSKCATVYRSNTWESTANNRQTDTMTGHSLFGFSLIHLMKLMSLTHARPFVRIKNGF